MLDVMEGLRQQHVPAQADCSYGTLEVFAAILVEQGCQIEERGLQHDGQSWLTT
jgi:hypothetical protein